MGLALLPDGSDELVPLGPLAVALAPVPVELLAVPLSVLCVVAEEPPVPRVDADTPLPAVALPPVPAVLELSALPLPVVEPVAAPPVVVEVVLSALRTPVPPSACRPAAKPLLSVVLPAFVPAVCAWALTAAINMAAAATRLDLSLCLRIMFILLLAFLLLKLSIFRCGIDSDNAILPLSGPSHC